MKKKEQTILKKYVRISLLLACFILCHSEFEAQSADTSSSIIEDGWIEYVKHKMAVDISLNSNYEIFEVKTDQTEFVLYPNTQTNLHFQLNYRFISVGFQFAPDFLFGNGDESLKGKTKSFEMKSSLVFRHWFADLSYSRIEGYYLQNSGDFIPRMNGDPYIQFPDLNYSGFSISSGYIHNSKFSLRSLTTQTERQLKSTGSFIPLFNFRYFKIDDQSSDVNTQMSKNIEASIGPGYAYTFVAKEKFYLSLGVFGSLGYLHTNFTTRLPEGDVVNNQDNFIFRWDSKVGVGYNVSRFYTGAYTSLSGIRYQQENTTVVNHETRIFYHLFIGMRFNSPRFIERQVKNIENKIP